MTVRRSAFLLGSDLGGENLLRPRFNDVAVAFASASAARREFLWFSVAAMGLSSFSSTGNGILTGCGHRDCQLMDKIELV
ncbi:hypothetical protein PanWU01x14_048150 [Parasponia andersonii]|uniref:Uncharacterized protein n=1 Tax=Parasponia andersonii TaxID=3476 RepID=A0A2P5DNA7_PARAD|nr:hypothetical protein PanWU01x14_048150 [Parasponia andersonii]